MPLPAKVRERARKDFLRISPNNKIPAIVDPRIEASASHADDMLRRGIDIRYVVTSLQGSDAEHLYETIYCARGQAGLPVPDNMLSMVYARLTSQKMPLNPLK